MRPIPSHTRRSGFTLIELIVVMTIIVVIASLALGVVSKGFGWVKQKNTEQTMTKVITRLQRVIDRLYKEADDWPIATEPRMYDQANGSMERARVIKVMYLYKWNFPNSYSEAFHNVQESRLLYSATGYPSAVALLNKLRSNFPAIPDPFAFTATQSWSCYPAATPAQIAQDLPWQSSACMLAAFTTANGSPDEFTSDEVITRPLPVGVFDPSTATINTNDNNPKLTDAWGTPFFFLRHGNFACSRHRFGGVGGVARPAWPMGIVRPGAIAVLDFAPIEYVLNPATHQPPLDWYFTSYYMVRLQERSLNAYPDMVGKDSFDPTGLLKLNNQWRTSAASAGDWLVANAPTPPEVAWLAPTGAGTQHGLFFRSTFGVSPENTTRTLTSPGNPNILIDLPFSPMVILSAGGDRIFNQWDDNLDSYRLQIYTGGQQ